MTKTEATLFVSSLRSRCQTRGGRDAAEAILVLDAADIARLDALHEWVSLSMLPRDLPPRKTSHRT